MAALGRQTCSSFKTFGLYLYKLNVRDLLYILVVAEREESVL